MATTVLFQDNCATYPADSNLAGGAAPTGSWTVSLKDSGMAYIHNGKVGDCSGAVDGSNYLGILRNGGWSQVDAVFAAQSNPSDLVRLEADVFGGAAATPYLAMNLGGAEKAYVMPVPAGTIYFPSSTAASAWTTGVWHHVAIDYHPTAATFDFSIDGNTQAGIATEAAGAIDRFSLASVGGWALYDNVKVTLTATPEPSSVVLLAAGLVGLLAYAWRKQR
jgi:hypothetical protein